MICPSGDGALSYVAFKDVIFELFKKKIKERIPKRTHPIFPWKVGHCLLLQKNPGSGERIYDAKQRQKGD